MTDYQQIKQWIEANEINLNIDNGNDKFDTFISNVTNHIIKSFIEHHKCLNITIEFDPYYHIKNATKGIWDEYYLTYKEQLQSHQTLINNYQFEALQNFKMFFGGEKQNIFTYMNQVVHYISSTHKKIAEFNANSNIKPHIQKCINAIYSIYFSSQDTSTISNIDTSIKLSDTTEDITIMELFEKYKLKYQLESFDNEKNTIGQKILDAFPEQKPLFLDETVILNKKLLKHIIIEGFHLSGKTTLAHQIGNYITNSYYIDLSSLDKTVVVDKDKNNIAIFLKNVHKINGTVILDKVNHNRITKTIAQVYFQHAYEIGIKLIFILTLEQFNDIKNVRTYMQNIIEDWGNFKTDNFLIEISPIKQLNNTRIGILKNFLINYLSYKKLNHLINLDIAILHYLDEEFGGMLYLIKIAIDNSLYISNLYELQYINISSKIIKDYSPLIEHIHMSSFIKISQMDIYLRINQNFYHDVFLIQNNYLQALIDTKKLYLVKEETFSQNYVLYFPNKIIPKILKNYLTDSNISKSKIFESKKTLKYLHSLSINNSMNLLRYLQHTKEEEHYFLYLSQQVLKHKYFSINSSNKISLKNLILVFNSFFKDKKNQFKGDDKHSFILQLCSIIIEKYNYLFYLLLEEPMNISLEFVYSLHKYTNIYQQNLKKKVLESFFSDYLLCIEILHKLQKTTIISIIDIFKANQMSLVYTENYKYISKFLNYLDLVNYDSEWTNEIIQMEQINAYYFGTLYYPGQ